MMGSTELMVEMLKADILMKAEDFIKDRSADYKEGFYLGCSLVWNYWKDLMELYNKYKGDNPDE